jgi:hypothetical protein
MIAMTTSNSISVKPPHLFVARFGLPALCENSVAPYIALSSVAKECMVIPLPDLLTEVSLI